MMRDPQSAKNLLECHALIFTLNDEHSSLDAFGQAFGKDTLVLGGEDDG